MARTITLIDSSFLFVLFNMHDKLNPPAMRVMNDSSRIFIIPQVVLTETAYLMNRFGGIPTVATFMHQVALSGIWLEPVTESDLFDGATIMRNYTTASLDFVDCCLMAMAERVRATAVCTLDYRDFSIIRTRQEHYLEIVPLF